MLPMSADRNQEEAKRESRKAIDGLVRCTQIQLSHELGVPQVNAIQEHKIEAYWNEKFAALIAESVRDFS